MVNRLCHPRRGHFVLEKLKLWSGILLYCCKHVDGMGNNVYAEVVCIWPVVSKPKTKNAGKLATAVQQRGL